MKRPLPPPLDDAKPAADPVVPAGSEARMERARNSGNSTIEDDATSAEAGGPPPDLEAQQGSVQSGAVGLSQGPAHVHPSGQRAFGNYGAGFRRRTDLEGRPSNKLYVGNLHPTVTEANIITIFSRFGKIIREQFFWHKEGPKKGEPRGFCIVEYAGCEEAGRAIDAVHGYMLKGRPVAVRYMLEQEGGPLVDGRFMPQAKARSTGGGGGRGAHTGGAAGPQRSGGGRGWKDRKRDRDEDRGERALDSKIRMLKMKLGSMQEDGSG